MNQQIGPGASSGLRLTTSVGCLGIALTWFALPAVSMAQDKPAKAADDIGLINPEAAAHAFPKRG
jgi:hypothetical protein